MWFAVRVSHSEEKRSRELLLSHFADVEDVRLMSQGMRHIHDADHDGCATATAGYMFVKLNIPHYINGKGMTATDKIWHRMRSYVSPWGYFYYHVDVENPATHKMESVIRNTKVHLLTADPKTADPESSIDRSRIPDGDMEAYLAFNDSVLNSREEAIIINEPFSRIARDRDVVRITDGLLAGVTGVLRQETQPNGMRDRRLVARFGKSMVVKYPNIRRYNMVVIREASDGRTAAEPRAWRMIDRMTAVIERQQLKQHDACGDAYAELRQWIGGTNRYAMDDTASRMAVVNRCIPNDRPTAMADRRTLFDLSTMFPEATDEAFTEYTTKYIPSTPIRPFLTPRYADTDCTDSATANIIPHEAFTEIAIPINLYDAFNRDLQPSVRKHAGSMSDYDYEAHVAVIGSGSERRAAVSWGGFFDKYAAMSDDEKADFAADLMKRGCTLMSRLLADDGGAPSDGMLHITFERVGGIGGFTMTADRDAAESARRLVEAVAPAAVEMWQTTRFNSWRALVRQYVLIHRQLPQTCR